MILRNEATKDLKNTEILSGEQLLLSLSQENIANSLLTKQRIKSLRKSTVKELKPSVKESQGRGKAIKELSESLDKFFEDQI